LAEDLEFVYLKLKSGLLNMCSIRRHLRQVNRLGSDAELYPCVAVVSLQRSP
jgi:hypothetical protein